MRPETIPLTSLEFQLLCLGKPEPVARASGIAPSIFQATALTRGSKLNHPTICSTAASLRFAAATCAVTATLDVSGISELSMHRTPNSPCESA